MNEIREAFNNLTKYVSSTVIHSIGFLIVLSFLSPYFGVNSLLIFFLSFAWVTAKRNLYHKLKCPQMKMMYRFNSHLFINYFYFIKRWMNFILNHLLSQPVSFIFRILDFLCLHNLNIFQSQTTLLYFMFYFNQTWTLFFIVGLFTVRMQITSYIRFQQTFLVKGQLVNIFGFTSHTVSVKIIHFYFCSMKAAMETLYK